MSTYEGDRMKVRVLFPTAFQHLDPIPVGGDLVTVDDVEANAAIANGYAEAVAAKVERATSAPGEKRPAGRPRKAKP